MCGPGGSYEFNAKVCNCIEVTKLKESVQCKCYILPSVGQTLAHLRGTKVFSKLDAKSGFWQIKLLKESALATTFFSPFGWYCFSQLPFGITLPLEYFQKQMSTVLAGLPESHVWLLTCAYLDRPRLSVMNVYRSSSRQDSPRRHRTQLSACSHNLVCTFWAKF